MGWEDPLEKEMATHSSILAWNILPMEEPGGAMGSQRVTTKRLHFHFSPGVWLVWSVQVTEGG